ncbi:hypothetical protein KFK09_004622 [Dendrobium nobile]|uniref:Uncharacterized protein n=1 Tax=Dendrobium nobile TaxID=94219 RepID=A0A8T3C163_DENNO|nr:hypothetical protein KFK09_004622 [Dendrobium nobile]
MFRIDFNITNQCLRLVKLACTPSNMGFQLFRLTRNIKKKKKKHFQVNQIDNGSTYQRSTGQI